MSLSTHVLDAVSGRPAAGVAVELTDAAGTPLASGRTDDDGRIKSLGATLAAGIYRLRFDTGEYFAASGTAGFYPEVVIAFDLTDVDAQYHVPLLLSPYAYSTYRGS
ncbi:MULTISPECIES: hydroxyisourate hydrolase [Mycobacterium]|uniref:5-hydroxyisourate hydrolase n=1 Tax=Mycobacterium pseudoshottsii TaxID=265949 RepID=A0A9N7QN82_9MYCO|nr:MULTISPECIES: hydroxyisourate hydrolase [Mycobacterium]ULL12988.1 hydroxyisourate hydrolase [Mycobacterium liflandii]EPQ45399.1 5-Hydroxyisourate Hydrolase [Mycobacterium sp. 012931]MBC9864194.1 5-hydroxyisourate hydrolase [Mycobacterium pseudoshottsii]RFZ59867.1 5-hydroxyisourate hydrolase precursor [Mycobacterium marinum]RFZ68918.1 5-hydroxyisourate hydrolase precursor [Mycobacterium marinum]